MCVSIFSVCVIISSIAFLIGGALGYIVAVIIYRNEGGGIC